MISVNLNDNKIKEKKSKENKIKERFGRKN